MFTRLSATLTLALLLALQLPEAGVAKAAKGRWISYPSLQRSIDGLRDSYSDVPSGINCDADTSRAARLICSSHYLRQLALLNGMARTYAIENATRSEVDHKAFQGNLPNTCRNKCCIYDFFRTEINSSLGAASPFATSNAQPK